MGSRAEAIAEIYAGFREGRAGAVEEVRGWVRAVVFGGNWRFADADSVVQQALLELLRVVARGRVQDPGGFQKFVYTVAKNTCVDTYHRDRRRENHEAPEDDQVEDHTLSARSGAADDEVEQRERYRMMLQIFQRLPESCRQLWNWVYGDGLAAAEVASRLGISVNNARVRTHRCLARAREIHDDQLAWPGGGQARDGAS